MIPGIMECAETCVHSGAVVDVVIGIPHRGRLNVLANVVQKPMEVIFQNFKVFKLMMMITLVVVM